MIIFENVESQRELEHVSKTIVDTLAMQLETALITKPFNPEMLAVNTKDLRISTSIKELQSLLDTGVIAFLHMDQTGDTTTGVWNGKVHDDTVDNAGSIKLMVDVRGVTNTAQIMAKFNIQKDSIESTCLHELQHAYDNWRSGDIDDFSTSDADGTYTHSGRSRAYIDPTFVKHAKSGHTATYDEYQNYTHEINARYTQAIADTKAKYKKSPVSGSRFIDTFEDNFVGWDKLPADAKRRLRSRAGAEHSEHKTTFKGKESDLKRAMRGERVDYVRDTKYSKIGYWFSEFIVHGRNGDEIVEKLQLLAIETSGMIAILLSDIRKNPSLEMAIRNGMKLGDWEKLGKDHMVYRG